MRPATGQLVRLPHLPAAIRSPFTALVFHLALHFLLVTLSLGRLFPRSVSWPAQLQRSARQAHRHILASLFLVLVLSRHIYVSLVGHTDS